MTTRNLSLALVVLLVAALAVLIAAGLWVSPYGFTVEAGNLVVIKVCLPAAGAIVTAVVAAKLLQRRTTAVLSGNRWVVLTLVAIGLLLAAALFRILVTEILTLTP